MKRITLTTWHPRKYSDGDEWRDQEHDYQFRFGAPDARGRYHLSPKQVRRVNDAYDYGCLWKAGEWRDEDGHEWHTEQRYENEPDLLMLCPGGPEVEDENT